MGASFLFTLLSCITSNSSENDCADHFFRPTDLSNSASVAAAENDAQICANQKNQENPDIHGNYTVAGHYTSNTAPLPFTSGFGLIKPPRSFSAFEVTTQVQRNTFRECDPTKSEIDINSWSEQKVDFCHDEMQRNGFNYEKTSSEITILGIFSYTNWTLVKE